MPTNFTRSWTTSILLGVLMVSACATPHFADVYRPGAAEVRLWRSEAIPLEPGWRYLGSEEFMVRGKIWNSNLTPADEAETLLFTRPGERGPEILLLTRVLKTGTGEIFTYLGGAKTDVGGHVYREAIYGLTSNSTDAEYRRYFERVRAEGCTPAPSYVARVRDRLPTDTGLVRIMELVPGEARPELPAFGALYPQERPDPLPRNFL